MDGLVVALAFGCLEAFMGILGLAEAPCLPYKVQVLEVGEAACEASDSTSSIVCPCQPLLTLTIA